MKMDNIRSLHNGQVLHYATTLAIPDNFRIADDKGHLGGSYDWVLRVTLWLFLLIPY